MIRIVCRLPLLFQNTRNGAAFELLKHSIWIGGDVDSIAALVLGLYGGFKGSLGFGEKGGLPAFLFEKVEGLEQALSLGKQFARDVVGSGWFGGGRGE